MNKHTFLNMILSAGCVLTLLTSCGTADRQSPSGAGESSDREQPAQSDTSEEVSDYITLAEAKSAVLENAGLSEDNVKFVRTHLDSGRDVAAYDIEFICENAEYDYSVHAVTGEILSMNCEAVSYDMSAVSQDSTQAADIQADTKLQPDNDSDKPNSKESDNAAGQSAQQNNNTAPQKTSEDESGSGSIEDGPYIGTQAAKQTALDHAGLKESDVYFAHAHLEQDDGFWKYDIEFHKDNTEYDYDIDALSGEILSYDQDTEYFRHGTDASPTADRITEDKAKEIALAHAGIAEKDTQRMKVKLDYDDGRAEYEVEWHIGGTEYSCDVDAYTGDILSFKKELD